MKVIFTENDFYVEESGLLSDEMQTWQKEFQKDKHRAWYLLGLKGSPKDADSSMRFLYRIAEQYF